MGFKPRETVAVAGFDLGDERIAVVRLDRNDRRWFVFAQQPRDLGHIVFLSRREVSSTRCPSATEVGPFYLIQAAMDSLTIPPIIVAVTGRADGFRYLIVYTCTRPGSERLRLCERNPP